MANSKRAFEDKKGLAASFMAMQGVRPPLSSDCGCEELRALIQTCWQHDPLHRMTMRACEEQLAILHRAISLTPAAAQPSHDGNISVPEPSDVTWDMTANDRHDTTWDMTAKCPAGAAPAVLECSK